MTLPSPAAIADAIASRAHARIVPDPAQAAYEAGLTNIRQTEIIYLTDGAPRKINLSNGFKIRFKHTSESRIFAFRSEKFQRLCLGIRHIGKDGIDDDVRRIIRYRLSEIGEDDFNKEISLPPAWVTEILLEIWNS